MERKYIFITGGVASGLGKGTMAASLGRLLKARGYKVTNQKFDPYINVDPGTMSPYRHGEVFVTDDGAECDLDIGHYERFTDENSGVESNITSGRIYLSVIDRERRGGYEGRDVQVIPHITDEIKNRIKNAGKERGADIMIVEIGGTVGDIESLPFLEAIRQMTFDAGRDNVLFVHLTLVPSISPSGEMKTKPTQHSVKELLSIGIQPDIIVCRVSSAMSAEMKDKIALFCNVHKDYVIQNVDAGSIYEIPLLLEDENLAVLACGKLGLPAPQPDLDEWRELVAKQSKCGKKVKIALVGKYVALHDAYLSVVEAINHAAVFNGVKPEIHWIDAEVIEESGDLSELAGMDGIIVPGGFGARGTLGKMKAAGFARENKIPFFGICLGMQCAVIEFARSVLGYEDAYTTEFTPDTTTPIIRIMPEQKGRKNLGGTIRRGAFSCRLAEGSLCRDAYGAEVISERHRHRYEVNEDYQTELEKAGLRVTGVSEDGLRIEAVELSTAEHPWFVGVQYHPEFKSRPNRPHPLFFKFVEAAAK